MCQRIFVIGLKSFFAHFLEMTMGLGLFRIPGICATNLRKKVDLRKRLELIVNSKLDALNLPQTSEPSLFIL